MRRWLSELGCRSSASLASLGLSLVLVMSALVYTQLLENPSPSAVFYITLVVSLTRTFTVLLISALGFSLAGGSLPMVPPPLFLSCAQGVWEGISLTCSYRPTVSMCWTLDTVSAQTTNDPQETMGGRPLFPCVSSSLTLRPSGQRSSYLTLLPQSLEEETKCGGYLSRRLCIHLA